jgi:hypothetical protein
MKRLRERKVVGVAIVAAAWMLCVTVVRAQVLQQVPGDSLVVFKVNNLKAGSDKFAKLAQDLGLAAMSPELADPLGALQAKLHVQQGLKTDGEMAIVFVDPAVVNGDNEKAMLVLLPVSDYKAFLGNWADAKTEAGISEVKMADNPEPAYIANWGSYAALSPAKEVIAKKPTGSGLSVPAVTAKEMMGKDAVLYANFAALKAKLLPQLQQSRTQIMSDMDEHLKAEPKLTKYAPTIKTLVNQFLNVAEGFLNQTQAATIGLALVPEGINTTTLAEFIPGSYAATTFTAVKNTDAPLLNGLPTGKYLVYGGGVSDPAVAGKVVSDFIDPVVKELMAVGPEMKPVQDYVAALKAYIGAQKGQTFGVIAPNGAVGAEPLLQFMAVQNGDAKVMSDSYSKMTQAQADVMTAFGVPGTAAVKPVFNPNAKTLDGVTFNQIVTKVDANAQDPAMMQQAQVMNMIYGPNGAVVNYGVLAPDKMLVASGVSDQLLSSAIAATKANQAPLADNDKIKAVAAQLPKQRVFVMYVPIDDIVTTGLNYAKQFGFAMNVQLPPDLPPVGMTGATEGTAIRVDSHIPTTLVQSLVAAGMQAAMQMQGGGPRGGGL